MGRIKGGRMNIENLTSSRLLKPAEVAKILSISRAQAYRLLQTGEIHSVRILGSVRVIVDDLFCYIEEHRSKNGQVGIQ